MPGHRWVEYELADAGLGGMLAGLACDGQAGASFGQYVFGEGGLGEQHVGIADHGRAIGAWPGVAGAGQYTAASVNRGLLTVPQLPPGRARRLRHLQRRLGPCPAGFAPAWAEKLAIARLRGRQADSARTGRRRPVLI